MGIVVIARHAAQSGAGGTVSGCTLLAGMTMNRVRISDLARQDGQKREGEAMLFTCAQL